VVLVGAARSGWDEGDLVWDEKYLAAMR
jgi:hypothetical protein